MLDFISRNFSMKYSHALTSPVLLMVMILSTGCASLKGKPDVEENPATEPPPIADILAEADKALGEGDIDTAQISYALVIERDPKNIEALYKLGYVHSRKNSPIVAVSLLRHALQVDPAHQLSRQLLGNVLLQMVELDEAEKAFDEILLTDTSAWQSLNGLGVIRDLQARHEEAQQYFEKAMELEPRSAKIANNLGYSHYLAGDFERAETLFLNALTFDNDYERAWSNLALLYSREGRIRDSSAAFRKIVSEHQAANNVGYLGMLQGNKALAREQLKRALQLSPSYYELANRNLEGLSEARASLLDTLPKSANGLKGNNNKNPVRENQPVAFTPPKVLVKSKTTPPSGQLSVLQMQGYLQFLGYKPGLVDGEMGASTRRAIRSFQKTHKLTVDGKMGKSSTGVLQRQTIRSVQRSLRSLGFEITFIDGKMGSETEQAIQLFQQQSGLDETGELETEVLDKLIMARDSVRKRLNSDDFLDVTSRG